MKKQPEPTVRDDFDLGWIAELILPDGTLIAAGGKTKGEAIRNVKEKAAELAEREMQDEQSQ